MGNSQY